MTTSRIPSAHLDLWRALLNSHAAVCDDVETRLRKADLPPLSWYDVLWALRRAPGRSLRMHQLAAAVVTISPSGLSRLVDRIEAAGLLRREPSATDRRGYDAVLTKDGSVMLRRMWPVYAAALAEHIVDTLTEEEADHATELLTRIQTPKCGVGTERTQRRAPS